MTDRPASARTAAPAPHRRFWFWGPVALYCLLIFVLSSVPDVPALPGGMSDKTGHFLLYAGLGFLVSRALLGGGRAQPALRVILLTVLCCAVYGLTDETHQLFVPNRQFDLLDLTADAAGGFGGAVGWWLWDIIGPVSGTLRRRPRRGDTRG